MISGTRYQLQLEVNRQLRLSTEIARGQAEISTGKKILAPSDDPIGAARISDLARSQADEAAWKINLTGAAAQSAGADTVLESLNNAYDRAGELMLAASNRTLSADGREAIALELQSIAEEVAVLRDTKDSRGQPLFPAAASAIRVPVAPGLEISATGTREAVFDTVVTPSGTSDVVSILNNAVAAVRSGGATAISTALGSVNAAGSHVIAAQAEQGTRGARIDDLFERNANATLGLTEERSNIESADIEEIVARLQARQLSLEAAHAVFARINKSTLFDLLS
jgi:flagellar hook-associated protein 3 FlgL